MQKKGEQEIKRGQKFWVMVKTPNPNNHCLHSVSSCIKNLNTFLFFCDFPQDNLLH